MSEPVLVGSLLTDPKFRTELGGEFGIVDDVISYCGYCGVEYMDKGLHVPSMEKQVPNYRPYPMTNRCPLHREKPPIVEKEKPQKQAHSEAIAKRWTKLVGEGSIFLTPDFDAYPRTVSYAKERITAKELIARYKLPESLLFIGGTGTQKSFMAYAICEKLCYRGQWVRILPPGSFSEEMIESFEKSQFTLWIMNVKNAGVLLLDDLGQERVTERGASALFSVINYRYEHRKPTIITTNFDGEHLALRLGEHNAYQIVRRIGEICTIVRTGATDERQIKF